MARILIFLQTSGHYLLKHKNSTIRYLGICALVQLESAKDYAKEIAALLNDSGQDVVTIALEALEELDVKVDIDDSIVQKLINSDVALIQEKASKLFTKWGLVK